MEFLSTHESGVCNHYKSNGLQIATIYSWIAEIREKGDPIQAWATIGSPYKNAYETYTYL
jgi:hypothetical protein